MKPRRSLKYHNRPAVVDGERFASRAEAARHSGLLLLQKVGAIHDLKRQPRFPLVVNGVKVCTYVADWSYTENGRQVVEDKKGVQTATFKVKWALAKALHPSIEWRLS